MSFSSHHNIHHDSISQHHRVLNIPSVHGKSVVGHHVSFFPYSRLSWFDLGAEAAMSIYLYGFLAYLARSRCALSGGVTSPVSLMVPFHIRGFRSFALSHLLKLGCDGSFELRFCDPFVGVPTIKALCVAMSAWQILYHYMRVEF